RESSEGCSTEEATLEFNEDSKSREEKPNLFQHDNKSNEEEIQNSGEVTSSEETHPEHPPQSARISNRRESRSRLENIAGPSNRRDTVDSVTGSSDQEEIKVPNTPESIINGHAHTNGNSDDCKDSVSLFSNQLHSKLEDLKSTSTNENSQDSHAGPSTRNDNQDSSEDLLCDESISSFSQATSNDSLEKSDQESLLEQPLHTKRRNDIINAAEDDNAV
ncbi:GSCOCG00009509001-RA-CDS, partial [Cotesia congregata]